MQLTLMQGGSGEVPQGWSTVTWTDMVAVDKDSPEAKAPELLEQMAKMAKEMPPELAHLIRLLRGMAPPPTRTVEYRAFLCPTCTTSLPLTSFHMLDHTNRTPVAVQFEPGTEVSGDIPPDLEELLRRGQGGGDEPDIPGTHKPKDE